MLRLIKVVVSIDGAEETGVGGGRKSLWEYATSLSLSSSLVVKGVLVSGVGWGRVLAWGPIVTQGLGLGWRWRSLGVGLGGCG
jgi:hypothetical protein